MLMTLHDRLDPALLRPLSALALALGLSVACVNTPHAEEPEEENPVERYFPLHDGTIYQYATVQPDGQPGVLVLSVEREGNEATLSAGNNVQHLEIQTQSIRNRSGHYHMKLPLTLGSSWQGQSGQVKVTQVELSITVEAGQYRDCVETQEQTQATVEVRTTRAVYCPNVGLVSLEVESQVGTSVARETAKLRYFGPKIDINAL
jgi:hypothetical protein